MNDEEIQAVLRSTPAGTQPLDPTRVIAGARRRRRNRGITAGVVASAAVIAVAVATAATTGTTSLPVPVDPPIAATPSPSSTTQSQPTSSRYTFQNEEPSIGTVPRDGEVAIGPHLYFATKGTEWAVISRLPGEPEYEPFGWRRTVGNENIGDETAPGLQSVGTLYASVFRSPAAGTVIYVHEGKAWYGKVNRLAGIPGWVQVAAQLTVTGTPVATAGGLPPDVSVFVYDRAGKLLTRHGDAADPLHG